ncbi:MAG: hypothetical protein C5B44_05255 [Acidobacteria bacterium]|nr:MAG: hypothetical protein C5B44_05255 [Acidobacteriota bacterium]
MSAKEGLEKFRITSPCNENWDAMLGNDRVRFCSHCNLSVHNASNLTRKDALRLIARSKGRLCMRYVALPDGSIKHRTPSQLYRIIRPASRLAAGAFGVTLSVSGVAIPDSAFGSSLSTKLRGTSIERPLGLDCSATSGAVISGFVSDSNGAIVPGASVFLLGLGRQSQTTTADDGQYRFEGLEAGVYAIRVIANGFVVAVITDISVSADSQNVINATLEVDSSENVLMGVVATVSEVTVPLVKAAQNDDIEAVKQLLPGTPNINVRDENSDSTALENAVLNSNREMIQVLLLAGADVNTRDKVGRTPLMLLGDDITADAVWDLINAGAKVNLRDEDGNTALIDAASCNNLEILKVLLDAGANVNAKNNDGETALMSAAAEGHVNNVRALILAGADVNMKDKKGKTAWTRAHDNDHKAVLRLFRSYGVVEQVEQEKQQ